MDTFWTFPLLNASGLPYTIRVEAIPTSTVAFSASVSAASMDVGASVQLTASVLLWTDPPSTDEVGWMRVTFGRAGTADLTYDFPVHFDLSWHDSVVRFGAEGGGSANVYLVRAPLHLAFAGQK